MTVCSRGSPFLLAGYTGLKPRVTTKPASICAGGANAPADACRPGRTLVEVYGRPGAGQADRRGAFAHNANVMLANRPRRRSARGPLLLRRPHQRPQINAKCDAARARASRSAVRRAAQGRQSEFSTNRVAAGVSMRSPVGPAAQRHAGRARGPLATEAARETVS